MEVACIGDLFHLLINRGGAKHYSLDHQRFPMLISPKIFFFLKNMQVLWANRFCNFLWFSVFLVLKFICEIHFLWKNALRSNRRKFIGWNMKIKQTKFAYWWGYAAKYGSSYFKFFSKQGSQRKSILGRNANESFDFYLPVVVQKNIWSLDVSEIYGIFIGYPLQRFRWANQNISWGSIALPPSLPLSPLKKHFILSSQNSSKVSQWKIHRSRWKKVSR